MNGSRVVEQKTRKQISVEWRHDIFQGETCNSLKFVFNILSFNYPHNLEKVRKSNLFKNITHPIFEIIKNLFTLPKNVVSSCHCKYTLRL